MNLLVYKRTDFEGLDYILRPDFNFFIGIDRKQNFSTN